MEVTNNLIMEPQNSTIVQCVPTHTNEKSMEIKVPYFNNEKETGIDTFVPINGESIALQENCLPHKIIGNKSAVKNTNSKKVRNKNDFVSNPNDNLNNLITLEFKSETNPSLSKDKSNDLNKWFSWHKTESLSYLKEFDEVLKEFQEINSNDTELLIPTLSETEYLLNSMNTNEQVKTVPVNSTLKHEDSEPFSASNEILLDKDSNDYVSIQKTSNNIKFLTRNNTTQLSPENYFRSKIVDDRTAFYTELNEDENTKFSKTLNDTKFQMEFEAYLSKTNEYNFSYDLSVESANTTVDEDEIDNMKDNINSEKTVEFNCISDEDIEKIIPHTINCFTQNQLFQTENSINNSDCEGYNSSDFEFITEDEACLGLVTNLYRKDESKTNANTFKSYNSNFNDYFKEPGPSNVSNYREDIDNFQEQYRNEHVIPNHEEYLELFSQPWSVYSFEAENKAFYSTKTMHVEVDNICFNVGLLQKRHEENKIDPIFQKEAKENAEKIISMYPTENRKRRRRI